MNLLGVKVVLRLTICKGMFVQWKVIQWYHIFLTGTSIVLFSHQFSQPQCASITGSAEYFSQWLSTTTSSNAHYMRWKAELNSTSFCEITAQLFSEINLFWKRKDRTQPEKFGTLHSLNSLTLERRKNIELKWFSGSPIYFASVGIFSKGPNLPSSVFAALP